MGYFMTQRRISRTISVLNDESARLLIRQAGLDPDSMVARHARRVGIQVWDSGSIDLAPHRCADPGACDDLAIDVLIDGIRAVWAAG